MTPPPLMAAVVLYGTETMSKQKIQQNLMNMVNKARKAQMKKMWEQLESDCKNQQVYEYEDNGLANLAGVKPDLPPRFLPAVICSKCTKGYRMANFNCSACGIRMWRAIEDRR